jgi:hypothetical protein
MLSAYCKNSILYCKTPVLTGLNPRSSAIEDLEGSNSEKGPAD